MSQCPRCGSKDRQYRGDLVAPHWAADDVTCNDPWHTPAPQPAALECGCDEHQGMMTCRRIPAGAPTPVREGAAEFIDGYDKPLRIRDGNHKSQIIEFAETWSAYHNAALREDLLSAVKRIAFIERELAALRKERDALQELAIELGHTPSQVENLLLSVRAALESTKD